MLAFLLPAARSQSLLRHERLGLRLDPADVLRLVRRIQRRLTRPRLAQAHKRVQSAAPDKDGGRACRRGHLRRELCPRCRLAQSLHHERLPAPALAGQEGVAANERPPHGEGLGRSEAVQRRAEQLRVAPACHTLRFWHRRHLRQQPACRVPRLVAGGGLSALSVVYRALQLLCQRGNVGANICCGAVAAADRVVPIAGHDAACHHPSCRGRHTLRAPCLRALS